MKPERKMGTKTDIKGRLSINFPSMQQVHIYLSSLHKKVKKNKKSVCVYLCCTQCSCFCCLLLLAKSHPAATWGQQSVPQGLKPLSSVGRMITNRCHLFALIKNLNNNGNNHFICKQQNLKTHKPKSYSPASGIF